MLSSGTVQAALRTLNREFNLWDTNPRDRDTLDWWQSRLLAAGITDANASARLSSFCKGWGPTKPTAHDICLWLREHGERREWGLTPEQHAEWMLMTLLGMEAPLEQKEAFAAEHPEYAEAADPEALARMFWPWLEGRTGAAQAGMGTATVARTDEEDVRCR